MKRVLAMGTLFAASSLPTIAWTRDVNVRSGDAVVSGHILRNLAFDPIDDLGLNGRVTATFKIERVIRGRVPLSVVTVRYVAHSYWTSGGEYRLHLRRAHDGTYLACSEGGGRGFSCD